MGSDSFDERGVGLSAENDVAGYGPSAGSGINAGESHDGRPFSGSVDAEPFNNSHSATDLIAGFNLSPPPPAAMGLMLPISPTARLTGNGHLAGGDEGSTQPEEINLMRDDDAIPDETYARRLQLRKSSSGMSRSSHVEDNVFPLATKHDEPSETTPLLGAENPHLSQNASRNVSITKQWEEAEGKNGTTWKTEIVVLIRYSTPLMLSCVLQYSLTGASVLAVGHLGKTELGAVSLASMTSNVTGYCIYEGLATSLDTLCAQAYGSGKHQLVGLHFQRMVYFLWLTTIPIALLWFFGTQVLLTITPERECAELAGSFLKILILGAPGFATFEAGKRFAQAQGIFNANLYVLLICAPLNAFMNWLFVWNFNWGFIGAPIAVAITNNLLPLCLWLYVYFVDGRDCWNGFTRLALQNWGPMIRLALPGLVMVLTEFIAFEILTLASSYISNTALAAQSVLATLSIVTFQVPFPISIAASTRLANLIGAGLPRAGKICVQVTLTMACFAGAINMVWITALRNYIPKLFTDDAAVTQLIVDVIPIFVAFQLFDALTANCNGILRGLGRQEVGGWVNVFCYYAIAIPVSFAIAFKLGWGLFGLWIGPATGLFLVCTIEGFFIYHTDWERVIAAADQRNESEAC